MLTYIIGGTASGKTHTLQEMVKPDTLVFYKDRLTFEEFVRVLPVDEKDYVTGCTERELSGHGYRGKIARCTQILIDNADFIGTYYLDKLFDEFYDKVPMVLTVTPCKIDFNHLPVWLLMWKHAQIIDLRGNDLNEHLDMNLAKMLLDTGRLHQTFSIAQNDFESKSKKSIMPDWALL